MHIRPLGAASIASAALLSSLAPHALAAPGTQLDLWADFQTPGLWMSQADNLHFYVQSPVVTEQMAGHTATTTISAPATLDCGEIGAGFVSGDVWTNVPFTVTTCTPEQATITWEATSEMVGARVFVNGWSATRANPATVTGTVTLAGASASSDVTARLADPVTPVAPGTSLGTWQGRTVSIASEAGANQLWVGGEATDAPAGNPIHSALADGKVTLWYDNQTSMDRWTLDLATQEVTTQSLASKRSAGHNPVGFLVETESHMGDWMSIYRYHDWSGTERHKFLDHSDRTHQFTDTAVVSSGYKSAGYSVLDIDGSVWPKDPSAGQLTPGASVFAFNAQVYPDRVEYTLRMIDPTGAGGYSDRPCTVTRTHNTCARP